MIELPAHFVHAVCKLPRDGKPVLRVQSRRLSKAFP